MNFKYWKMFISILLFSVSIIFAQKTEKSQWKSDNGDETYTNPIIFSDYSDPDVIRVNDNYLLVSSSLNCVPGIPILQSKDLVNWKIIGHVLETIPNKIYDTPQHGNGVWAPSIRYHNGKYWVYYGDPDFGVFVSTAVNPIGPWSTPVLAKSAKGWIDPCPLWDNDGNGYIVHAWAKSRAGFNSILTVNRMSPDGMKILDEGINVFDGHNDHPTIEGPKFYKRNGYFYIFAPAGGVVYGWQTVLRSKNIFGPYEDKIILHQGNTDINGPHQGAWIETETGESWFLHFQDRGAYGRILHLQPMTWKDDWPFIGIDINNDGIGEPVQTNKKPYSSANNAYIVPQTSDEFDTAKLGLQWQWQANPDSKWFSLSEKKGSLRLFSIPVSEKQLNLWNVPNLLLQKIPSPEFCVTAKVNFDPVNEYDLSGMVLMGSDYSYLALKKVKDEIKIVKVICKDANKEGKEIEEGSSFIKNNPVYLKVCMINGGVCEFSFSTDGVKFDKLGNKFMVKKDLWIGAKIGLFNISVSDTPAGYSDFEWFRFY